MGVVSCTAYSGDKLMTFSVHIDSDLHLQCIQVARDYTSPGPWQLCHPNSTSSPTSTVTYHSFFKVHSDHVFIPMYTPMDDKTTRYQQPSPNREAQHHKLPNRKRKRKCCARRRRPDDAALTVRPQ